MSLEPTAHGEWWVRYGESTFIFRDDSVGLLMRLKNVRTDDGHVLADLFAQVSSGAQLRTLLTRPRVNLTSDRTMPGLIKALANAGGKWGQISGFDWTMLLERMCAVLVAQMASKGTVTALPARVVSAAPPQSREGVSVSENVWFKHWAKKSLGSNDLNSLTDHEERIWWRFLSVASAEEPRWHVRLSPKLTLDAIAYSCHSTPAKLRAALKRFETMAMLTATDDGWVVTNWEKHQETPEARRQRLKRDRDRDMSRDSHAESNGESNASLLREEEQRTDLLSTKEVAPKRRSARKIEESDIDRWQAEYPHVDIPAMVKDYENWKGSDGHKDRVLGFQNQLRDQWRLEKFAKKTPERRYNREEGIFAGVD